MTSKVTKFEDLKVWQISHELTLEVYRITKTFPRDELYGLVAQLRKAASSVPANIVEGYYRHTTKELIKFLYNARGSAGEVAYFFILSKDLEYISNKEYIELRKRYEALLRSISAMINSLSKK
ncbi:MAG: four helix bundle protein [Candidatus Omnitrophica bacterium]|nr:four helix bundle protein [Candidatus Omnitrophota bacterium]